MRPYGLFASLLLVAGCAPMADGGDAASARRCFPSAGAQLIKLDPGSGAYLRVRSGEALEFTGDAACLNPSGDPTVTLRPLGPDNADVCLGDAAHLDIRSHAVPLRSCNVRLARVVPRAEIERMPDRESP
jgi:hypothetical protein